MINRPTAGKSSSSYRAPSGLYKAIVSRVVGVDVYVTVPRMTDSFEHGPIPYAGAVPTVGDETYVGFLEGRPDDVVALFGNAAGETFAGPIEPTFLVASSTARQAMKDVADYVCTGTNDQETIQEALDDLPAYLGAYGGKVVLTEGRFYIVTDNIDGGIWMTGQGTVLSGVGPTTILDITSLDSGTEEWGVVMNGEEQVLCNLTIDMVDSDDLTYGVLMNDNLQSIRSCVFANAGAYNDIIPLAMWWGDNNVSDCIFNGFTTGDNGAAIHMWGGQVSNCEFTSQGGNPGIIAYNSTANGLSTAITGNTFTDCGIHADGVSDLVVSNNTIDSLIDGIIVENVDRAIIDGNLFWTETPGDYAVVFRGDNNHIEIGNNHFWESGIGFAGTLFTNTFIDIFNNKFNGGTRSSRIAVISSSTAKYQFEHMKIVGNVFTEGVIGFAGIPSGRVWLGLEISGNLFVRSTINTSNPFIDIEYGRTPTDDSNYAIHISDNTFIDRELGQGGHVLAVDILGTPVFYSPNRALASIVVANNVMVGVSGIRIRDCLTDVTVRGNTLSPDYSATDTYPGWWGGGIHVSDAVWAFVENNDMAIGDRGDMFGGSTGAVIYVEAASGGKVLNNSVIGHNVASGAGNLGAVNTAMEVDGPLTVDGNIYLGVGTNWASVKTPLTNELVISGTGAKVGSNSMKIDTSGATTPKIQNMRETVFSMQGDLTAATGNLRLPFREAAEIVSISAMVGTAPTGASIQIDVNLDGGTDNLYTTQGNRPTVLATEFDTGLTYPDVTAIPADSYLSVDVDQIGSTIAGADLTVIILWRPA